MKHGTAAREALTLSGPSGRLEALLDEPPERLRGAVAVVCHPHPQHQGTMLNKVVHTLARAMVDQGVPVVRFNFRGVGASEGAYAGGPGEADDLAAVAGWARSRYPAAELWLGGFSFGAAVAVRASLGLAPRRLVAVAPPVSRMADFVGAEAPLCPSLIVQGEADEVVRAADVREWAASRPVPPELVVLPEVDHFFHGRLSLLRTAVVEYLARPVDT